MWWLLVSALFLYLALILIYRLYFHPLSRFPGPKIAAATKWYEAYHDLRPDRPGTFYKIMQQMHSTYGPIVRINPDELHIDDSTWVDKLYVTPARGIRDKHPPATLIAGTPDTAFGAISHDLHRKRRSAINSLFSKGAAASSVDVVYDKTELLLQNVDEQIRQQGFSAIKLNWLAMVVDFSTEYFFNYGMNLQKDESKAQVWSEAICSVALSTPFVKQFTWLIPLAVKLPIQFLQLISPQVSRIVKLRRDFLAQAKQAVEGYEQVSPEKEKFLENHRVYNTILNSPVLDKPEKEPERISQEAFNIFIAGGDTTARIFSTGTFHVLENRNDIMPHFRAELVKAMPDPRDRLSIQDLEKLPWLTAIVKESLRISAVVTSRLPVVAPHETLQYQNWTIPPGTAVSLSLRDILLDPKIFEDPEKFKPERWLPSNPNLAHLNHYLVPFSRGSRMCVGVNFAMVLLYVGFATFFRQHDFVLHDTNYERDVKIVQDCFNGEPSSESKGVRVKYASSKESTGI